MDVFIFVCLFFNDCYRILRLLKTFGRCATANPSIRNLPAIRGADRYLCDPHIPVRTANSCCCPQQDGGRGYELTARIKDIAGDVWNSRTLFREFVYRYAGEGKERLTLTPVTELSY